MKIESWEDRSGNAVPGPESYGYVYFTNGARVGYSPDIEGHLPVWQPRTNGGGKYQEVTVQQLKMAMKLLYDKGVITDEHIAQLRAAAGV
jgi:hypothetical protein